jgi:hypothetical protein
MTILDYVVQTNPHFTSFSRSEHYGTSQLSFSRLGIHLEAPLSHKFSPEGV